MPWPPCPYRPLKTDIDGVPVFCSLQVELYGAPHHYGILPYRVEEARDSAHPLALDWPAEQAARGNLRPIHRYSRVQRFRATLLQLLGDRRDDIPLRILYACNSLDPASPLIWTQVRRVLKTEGALRTYQNSIPTIIRKLGGPPVIRWEWEQYLEVMSDFCRLSVKFDQSRALGSVRRYFPSLRFIALKLLRISGAVFNVPVPLAVVARKVREMEEWWYEFYE